MSVCRTTTVAPEFPANCSMSNYHVPFPAPIRLPAEQAPLACVDIGGTKVAVSVVDARGLRSRVSEPTATEGANHVLAQQVLRLIDQACAFADIAPTEVAAVGVATCGPFVLRQGLIELVAPNICGGLAGQARGLPNDWTSAVLEAPLRAAFAQVRVENDGIAALEAERRWGALQGCSDCAYVTWSTGIGMGLCVDGRLLRGRNGNAGHAGHTLVCDDSSALCGCGQRGDVEALVAGNAIARRFAAQGYADAAQLFSAAVAGDATAAAIVDSLCAVLGRALFNLSATLDLQRIAIGGSVFWNHRDYLLPRLRAALAGRLPPLTQGLDIVAAGLGERVGDFAALALVCP